MTKIPEHRQKRKIDRVLAVRKKLCRLAEERSLDQLMKSLVDEAEKLTDSRIGYFCCLAEDGKSIRGQSWSSAAEILLKKAQPNGDQDTGIPGSPAWQDCLKSARPVMVNDFGPAARPLTLAGVLPFFRTMVVPVIRGQQVVALLGLGNKPSAYDQDDSDLVGDLADLCWDIIAKKQVEDVFGDNPGKTADASPAPALGTVPGLNYQELLNSLNDAVFLMKFSAEMRAHIIDINSAAIHRYGYTRNEFLQMTAADLIAPGHFFPDKIARHTRHLQETGEVLFESMHITKSGDMFATECNASLITFDGGKCILATVRDISERKQIEEQLREKERLFQLITNNISDVVWILDPVSGEFSYHSASVEQLRGYTPEEAMEMNLAEILTPDSFRKARERIALVMSAPEMEKGLETIELQQYHKNGSIIDIEVVARPIRNEHGHVTSVVGITRDITERKKAEHKLQAEKDKFRSLFEHITDYVLILQLRDDDLVITDMSESACKYHGYTRKELIGQSIALLDPQGFDKKQAQTDLRAVQEGKTVPFETVHRRKDGSTFPVGAAIKQIEIDGEPYLFAIEHDLTQQKKAEEERHELEQQLRQKYKMEAVGLMAGGIAHNFNNNLAIILGNLELINMKMPAEANLGDYLENALIGVHRSRELVQQIMTYSRQNMQSKSIIQPDLVIEETCKLLRSTIPTSVKLDYRKPTDPDLAIMADSTRIQEAMINLCTNAVHAMQEKGTLTISLQKDNLAAANIPAQFKCPPGDYVCLAISDTGTGIKKDVLEKIFDPFFTTKDVDQGTGMGLSTVLGIVEQHDGLVKVETSPGKGSTFLLYFPLASTAGKPAEARGVHELPRGSERILLIDDDAMLARVNGAMLADMGYQVEIESRPREALARLRSEPDRFDLVMTDQTMPEMTGDELAREAQAISPRLPIILCTGYSSKMTADQAHSLGLAAFCVKPLDMPELLKVVRNVLDSRSSDRPGA